MSALTNVPQEWHANFFTPSVNRFWEAMIAPDQTAADIAYLRQHAGLQPPASVLDIPCGSGRHSLALAAEGFRVTGIDLSEDAIARAGQRAAEQGLPVRFERRDMRDAGAGDRHDAAICLGNSLSYFDAAGLRQFLARLAGGLRSGGRLVLDTHCCAESIFPLSDRHRFEFPGGSYAACLAYDATTSVLHTEAVLMLDGVRHDLRYTHAVITSGMLVTMLKKAGLVPVAMHGDTDGRPFVPGDRRLLLVARRT